MSSNNLNLIMKKLKVNIEKELESIKFDVPNEFGENYYSDILSKMNEYEKRNKRIYVDFSALIIFLIIFNFISIISITPKKKIVDLERTENINLIINTFSLDK